MLATCPLTVPESFVNEVSFGVDCVIWILCHPPSGVELIELLCKSSLGGAQFNAGIVYSWFDPITVDETLRPLSSTVEKLLVIILF
jgi:hypothetical protein